MDTETVLQSTISKTLDEIEQENQRIIYKIEGCMQLVRLYEQLLEINQENYKVWKTKELGRVWKR